MTALAQPPGQLHLLPPPPAPTATSYRVVTLPPGPAATPRWSDTIRDLPVAASRAARAAALCGEAWLVAADFSAVHITAARDVTPSTGTQLSGWAVLAARVITNLEGTPRP